MTSSDETETATLRTTLRDALSERDRRASSPSFAFESLIARGSTPSVAWRPALAMVASTLIIVAGVLLWRGNEVAETFVLDARLVEELSPVSYWSVPSDELLAYAPTPVSLDIAVDSVLPVSLEESLL